MRKLIRIIYACCVTGKAFDPAYQQQKAKMPAAKPNGQLLTGTLTSSAIPNLAAPVSKKEAKKRKAATMPQKGRDPLMRGLGAAHKNNNRKTF